MVTHNEGTWTITERTEDGFSAVLGVRGGTAETLGDGATTPGGLPVGAAETPRTITIEWCCLCHAHIGVEHRPGTGWLCRTCSGENPVLCEFCNERRADFTEYGYAACARCKNEGRAV